MTFFDFPAWVPKPDQKPDATAKALAGLDEAAERLRIMEQEVRAGFITDEPVKRKPGRPPKQKE